MSSVRDPSRRRFELRAGLRLQPMADGSGVLAGEEPSEAHALNAEATRLLSFSATPSGVFPARSGTTWSEASLAAELRAGGASAEVAAAQAMQFLDGLRALGALVQARD